MYNDDGAGIAEPQHGKAKRKSFFAAVGKYVVANIGNIAVMITIAILASQIRQDLANQQGEVAELRTQTTDMKNVLVAALNTTREITVQATALEAKISIFETLLSNSREDELQKLFSDLREVNASLFQQLQSWTVTLAHSALDITANTTSALSSIQSVASATSSSLQALNSSAVSRIQTVSATSMSTLQTFNDSAVTTQESLLNQTKAAAAVSANVSSRVSALEQLSSNLSPRLAILEQASTNVSARISPLEQVSTNMSSRLSTVDAALKTNYTGTVRYCGNTSSVNGAMGGYKAAAQTCRQQQPSCGPTAHMCTADEMLQLSFRNTTQLPDIAWVASGVYAEYASSVIVDDCNGYTSNSNAGRAGPNWAYNTFPGDNNCASFAPIACCAYNS